MDAWSGFANGFEEMESGMQIDAVAEVEICFGAGGHDAVENVDCFEIVGENVVGGVVEVGFDGSGVGLVLSGRGDGRQDYVGQDDFVAGVEEMFCEELAYEAASACNEYLLCHDGVFL